MADDLVRLPRRLEDSNRLVYRLSEESPCGAALTVGRTRAAGRRLHRPLIFFEVQFVNTRAPYLNTGPLPVSVELAEYKTRDSLGNRLRFGHEPSQDHQPLSLYVNCAAELS